VRDREPDVDVTPAPRLARRLAPLVLAAAVAACGLFGRQPGDEAPGGGERAAVTVNVRNLAWKNIHVYVIAGGSWESLGVLSSQDDTTYEVSRTLLGGRREIRLAADPVGSREGFISDPILVEPGDRVEWTIQDNLALSSVFVR